MNLPNLVHDWHHSLIRDATPGPRRELSLLISPLIWNAGNGRHGPEALVRFGGIENYAEVAAFCAAPEQRVPSELADLRYSTTQRSWPGRLCFEVLAERADAILIIRCRNLLVGLPGANDQDGCGGVASEVGSS